MTDFRTRTEIEIGKVLSIKENETRLLKWAFHHLEGQGVPSTVHYTNLAGEQENTEEWAIPISRLPQVLKELIESLEEG